MQYLALLRGVNVGGKNKLSMAELKTAFEQHGFTNVLTYINSGNILFWVEHANEETLQAEIRAMIAQRFQMDITTAILAAEDLLAAMDHAPAWWGADKDSKHNAIVVIVPTTVEEVFASVGESKPEYEKVDYHGRVIFWSAPRTTFSRTRWSGVVATVAYQSVTIRNANTMRKLAALIRAAGV